MRPVSPAAWWHPTWCVPSMRRASWSTPTSAVPCCAMRPWRTSRASRRTIPTWSSTSTPASAGSRYSAVEGILCELTGAEAALVVNNNAGAVLLTLETLARGRQVVVSRGRAGGDRRRFPGARCHGPQRLYPEGGGHHQPDPPARLPGGHRGGNGAAAQGAHQQLQCGGLHQSRWRQ
jgi:hypothetical protein